MSTQPLAPPLAAVPRVTWRVEETDGFDQWRLTGREFGFYGLAEDYYHTLLDIGERYSLETRLRIVKTTTTSEVVDAR